MSTKYLHILIQPTRNPSQESSAEMERCGDREDTRNFNKSVLRISSP